MADDVVLIDVQEGTKRVMNNIKLYVKLLGKFKEDKSLENIENALGSGDTAGAQSAAHTFKGLTANLSLTELYKQSMELESQIKSGSVKNEQLLLVKDIYSQTITEIDKVTAQNA